MKFTLSITCDNASFDDLDTELARLLDKTAQQVRDGYHYLHGSRTIFDSNGNDVGRYKLEGEREIGSEWPKGR